MFNDIILNFAMVWRTFTRCVAFFLMIFLLLWTLHDFNLLHWSCALLCCPFEYSHLEKKKFGYCIARFKVIERAYMPTQQRDIDELRANIIEPVCRPPTRPRWNLSPFSLRREPHKT